MTRTEIEQSPYLYRSKIEVFDGYGMDVDLPTKVRASIVEAKVTCSFQLIPHDL